MLIYLILLMTTVPFLELYILLQVHHAVSTAWGSGLGLLVTLGTVIITGVLGAALARQQGLSVIKNLTSSIGRGELPETAMADGVLILIGAALLLTPGFLTDLIGFSLLIPFTRVEYRKRLIEWAKQKVTTGEMKVNVTGFDSPLHSQQPQEMHYEPNLSEESSDETKIE